MNRFIPLLLLLLLAISSPADSLEGTSIALGKKLFESEELGKAGRSCATCHPEGKGLEEIDAYSDVELKGIVNGCIQAALKGKPLEQSSQEMESLIAYLRSLQNKK